MRYFTPFNRYPIKKKLLTSVMATSIGALVLCSSVFMSYDFLVERQDRLEDATAIADTIANASAPAMASPTPEKANDVLLGLKAHSGVTAAILYRPDGSEIASFLRPGASRPPAALTRQCLNFQALTIHLSRPVTHENSQVGQLYIQYDMSSLTTRFFRFLAIELLVILLVSAVMYVIISRIMRYIAAPLQDLADTARTVTLNHDYSRRVEQFNPDEIGMLANSFNIMLQQLEERDHQISSYHSQLESQVHQRTAELETANLRLLHEIEVRTKAEQARLLAEDELLKSRKLESIGILAGGIAHDFNNILTSVVGFITLARNSAHHAGKAGDFLKSAERGCFRAKNLTRQLLTFSRGGTSSRRPQALLPVIRESIDISMVGSNVLCNLEAPDKLPLTLIDSGQIIQVLNNILINACQAMPTGGQIDVRIDHITARADIPVLLPDSDYVRISIQDCGSGIAAENLHKVFDPYFSTKPMGSGLGLSTCYAIIKNHEGFISVASQPDNGTLFQVYLPTCHACEIPLPLPAAMPPEAPAAKRRILIMDDEADIREVASGMFELAGCEVALSNDGAAAVRLFQTALEAGTPYDLVVLDITIPGGMGGVDTVKLLLELDNSARVIVSSGYADEPVMADYKSYGFSAAISKPYTLNEIKALLQSPLLT